MIYRVNHCLHWSRLQFIHHDCKCLFVYIEYMDICNDIKIEDEQHAVSAYETQTTWKGIFTVTSKMLFFHMKFCFLACN